MDQCGSITNAEILAILFVIAPQFATTDPIILGSYNTLIDALRCMINCSLLGCCAELAFANLLAHYLTMQGNQYLGIGTNISEGQLSIGLSSTVNSNAFASTPYGQQYLNILSRFRVGAYVTNIARRFYGPSCGCGY